MPTFQAPSVRPFLPSPGGARRSPRRWPLLIAGGAAGAAQAQSRAFSPGWFADKGAAQSAVQRSGRLPDGSLAGVGNASQQQAQSRQQLQRSLDNLNRTAAAVAAQQAAQAARGGGGRQRRRRVGRTDAGRPVGGRGRAGQWEGAKAPRSAADGRQVVTIEQTQSRAILNWDSFNVGRNTTLQFKQNASDAALNRVVGASAKPSEIHGAIKADGTVLVVNQNGVIFTGTSQVNARNLVAAAAATITDQQFRDKGIYTDATARCPPSRMRWGRYRCRPARASTPPRPPPRPRAAATCCCWAARSTTPAPSPRPAARPRWRRATTSTSARATAPTATSSPPRPAMKSATLKPASTAGLVRNSGLISATTGDITLTGHQIRQDGVLVASTDIGARGAIHLLNRASDASGSVTLGAGSVTAVLLEPSAVTGLEGQRTAALKTLDGIANNNTAGVFDNLSTVADRPDLPRIEVVSGNLASFLDGSTTLATGGQIAVSARAYPARRRRAAGRGGRHRRAPGHGIEQPEDRRPGQ